VKRLPAILPLFLVAACARSPEPPRLSAADSLAVVQENLAHRTAADRYFADDASSPFRNDTTVTFTGLRWYPVDPRYRVQAQLRPLRRPEAVTIMGTRGEERRLLRYGVFTVDLPDGGGGRASLVINVYKDPARGRHLSIWFTDETTGRETYGVGRYLDVGEEHPDPGHYYTLDFNRAYNPWCAYSDHYTCAVPRREDHLAVPLRVGELPYRTEDLHGEYEPAPPLSND
jgi:uncharacterized protein (DUF1684 family)